MARAPARPAAKAAAAKSERELIGPVAASAVTRNAAVFMAVVVAFFLVRFFRDVLSPLVVATFLLLLIDALSRVMATRLPGAPRWIRRGVAAVAILAGFAAVGGIFVLKAPPFAADLKGLGPRLDAILASLMRMEGVAPVTIGDIFAGVDPTALLERVFLAARRLISYSVLVIIYFGFLLASRATFERKIDQLYDTEAHRSAALRVTDSVRNAVERFVRLQTLKALMMALVAFGLMLLFRVHDALFIAFLVFLSAYIPIIGPIVGAIFPGLVAIAQFQDLGRPLLLSALLGAIVLVIDNVLMPKLASDELNVDPLLVLVSLGFWAAILGTPGVLLSTPLTVTIMAIAAEFESTHWLAVLISREGHPNPEEAKGKA
jgi:predicted PurR-regulated permease PerM